MRILHTADWHAGRSLHGTDLTPDIGHALDSLVEAAREHEVDAVLVAGDLFDSPTPSAAAESVVYRTLDALAKTAPVAVIAGNHDSPDRINALRPMMRRANIYAIGLPTTPVEGGVRTLDTPNGPLQVASVPFVSHRRLVRAGHLLGLDERERREPYLDGMMKFITSLTRKVRDSTPSALMLHGTLEGSTLSSEYAFHSTDHYTLPANALHGVTYAALGHIHAPQAVEALDPLRARYSGSVIPLDYGEAGQERGALLVTLDAKRVHSVEPVPLATPHPLVLEDVTLDGLEAFVSKYQDARARVKLRLHLDAPKPGIKERLHRDLACLTVVETVLPEYERPEPLRLDTGEVDLRDAFKRYHEDQRGRSAPAALLAAFDEVDAATTPREDP